MYVTHSGRGIQTAHSNDKVAEMPRLAQLLLPLLDTKILNF
jgi:hypothetical protein